MATSNAVTKSYINIQQTYMTSLLDGFKGELK